MKYFVLVSALCLVLSCKNNKELKILEEKAPVTELKSQEAHMQAAITYLNQGKTEEALKELTQSIRTYHNEEAYIMKTNILLQEKRYFEFLENTEDAMRFEQFQSPILMMQNGLGLELTGQEEKATDFYKKAVFEWTLEGANEQNYGVLLTQKTLLSTVLFGKDIGLKDFDKIFADFAKNKRDTLIREEFRPLIERYDGSGMSFFFHELQNKPTE